MQVSYASGDTKTVFPPNHARNMKDPCQDAAAQPEESYNDSRNPHLFELVPSSLSRREVIHGGLAAAVAALAPALASSPALAAAGSKAGNLTPQGGLTLGFDPVAKNLLDRVSVPAGYDVSVLHALGDPLVFGEPTWRGDGSETPDSYEYRIGDGHDGMWWFGMDPSGRFNTQSSARGLLCVNHEYVVPPFGLHPQGRSTGDGPRHPEEVRKEILAHGVSVVEVRRSDASARMAMVRGSRYNRRITSATPMELSGPARGSALLKTRYSPDGTQTRGTNNNCANGHTPWGTYLTCEENFTSVIARPAGDDRRRPPSQVKALQRYGLPAGRASRFRWDTAGSDDLFARWSSAVSAEDASQDYRHVINTFGWVVEIDPFNPTSKPVKRTALGRYAREGAWPSNPVAGQPLAFYSGDDSRNEYIYKFVSKAVWDPRDAQGGLSAGNKYLDEGTLYVARFLPDGSGQWLELTHGKSGLDVHNSVYPFADQADVLIHARLAADAVGATKMDRPEWGGVNPLNGEVYMTLTNNSARRPVGSPLAGSQQHPNAANPRAYNDPQPQPHGAPRAQEGNPNGHIIRWREAGGRSDASTFAWDIFLFGARATAPADVNLSGLSHANDFSSPDGLCFDPRGILWIQTDDGAYTDTTHCMMLAAVPGQVGDGGPVTAAGGVTTMAGAPATPERVRRFLVGPADCEVTGVVLTPDARTMFVNIQHPGDDGSLQAPTSQWPASQFPALSAGPGPQRPRSATVVITRRDGGAIGV